MGRNVFFWFLFIYILANVFHEINDYRNKKTDYIEANVRVAFVTTHPVVEIYHNNKPYLYSNPSWSKYSYVDRDDYVNIRYKFDSSSNKIQDAFFTDFRHRYFSIDKLIVHLLILVISFMLIYKNYGYFN